MEDSIIEGKRQAKNGGKDIIVLKYIITQQSG
jgi:hypothetical protein